MKLSPKLSGLVSLALFLAACPSGPPPEDCQNGLDDDGDSRVDCSDSDCAAVVACIENCFNGIDDNGDLLVDCQDSDCAQNPACQEPVCGDGALEGDEECDGQDFGGASCLDFGFDSGTLACDAGCLIDSSGCFDAEVCDNNIDDDLDGQTDCDDADCTGDFACPVCGDGALQSGEQCDGQNLDNQSCLDFGFNSGSLACDNACQFDTTGCLNVEICGDGADNDSDGQFDCADADCVGDPVCLEQGNCDDNADNDLDGQADCADADCASDPICQEAGNCDDNSDNDLDGQFDCADADCANDPICLEQGNCDDNADNDLDGQTDCADADCAGDFLCPVCGDGALQSGEQCDGQNLNNQSCLGLGFDGGDLACDNNCSFNTAGCFNFEVCDNNADDDLDGQADCADSDCAGAPNCQEAGNCDDNSDNDLDGQFDCADADCTNDPICLEQGNCNDNSDNDLDGQTDCADSDCAGDFLCPVCGDGALQSGEQCDGQNLDNQSCLDFGFNSGSLACDNACQFDTTGCADVEICANGIDDDGDGLLDCGDLDCEGDVACGDTPTGGLCVFGDECDGGVCLDEVVNGFPEGYCSELCDLNAGLCGADGDGICTDVGLGNGQGFCLDACSLTGNDCGIGYSCIDVGVGNGDGVCFPDCTDDAQCPAAGFCNADDGFCNTSDETCDNVFDDDGDGFIDCDDLDCSADLFCAGFEDCANSFDDDGDGFIDCQDIDCDLECQDACFFPIPVGDPSTVDSNNIGRGDITDGTCQLATGGGGGAEIAFLFQPAFDGTLNLTLDSAADLVVYVQTACGDAGSEIACADLAFGGATETLQVDVFAGETLFVFVDGFAPGEESTFTLQVFTQ